MVSKASNKLRPEVIALQKRGIAAIIKRVESAVANGTLTDKPAREIYRAKVRVRTRRAADSES
jgi:hypothetical protein